MLGVRFLIAVLLVGFGATSFAKPKTVAKPLPVVAGPLPGLVFETKPSKPKESNLYRHTKPATDRRTSR